MKKQSNNFEKQLFSEPIQKQYGNTGKVDNTPKTPVNNNINKSHINDSGKPYIIQIVIVILFVLAGIYAELDSLGILESAEYQPTLPLQTNITAKVPSSSDSIINSPNQKTKIEYVEQKKTKPKKVEAKKEEHKKEVRKETIQVIGKWYDRILQSEILLYKERNQTYFKYCGRTAKCISHTVKNNEYIFRDNQGTSFTFKAGTLLYIAKGFFDANRDINGNYYKSNAIIVVRGSAVDVYYNMFNKDYYDIYFTAYQ